MKKILILNFILVCLLSNLQSQKIIELAVSYDVQYANLTGTPEQRINDIIVELNDAYDNYGVEFQIVAIESFGTINLSGSNIDPVDVITQAWVNGEDLCYKRDLVLHFTGSELSKPQVNGESKGYSLCESNSIDLFIGGDFNGYALIVKFQPFFQEVRTAAHELGHGMGLGHEDESSVCNGPFPVNENKVPFMCCCGEGPTPDESTTFF